jgi:hypothetical protein
MRVLTLNLWGRRGDWDGRRAVLVDALRELHPDLVAFQEAVVTREYDQVGDLIGPEFHLAHQSEREPGDKGVERGCGARSRRLRRPRRWVLVASGSDSPSYSPAGLLFVAALAGMFAPNFIASLARAADAIFGKTTRPPGPPV